MVIYYPSNQERPEVDRFYFAPQAAQDILTNIYYTTKPIFIIPQKSRKENQMLKTLGHLFTAAGCCTAHKQFWWEKNIDTEDCLACPVWFISLM